MKVLIEPYLTYKRPKYFPRRPISFFTIETVSLKTAMSCSSNSPTSTGIGAPGLEICLHELREVGVETAIRVGTTGSITEKFDCGDLIIPVAAIRRDGTTDQYVESGFPAYAHYEVVLALIE